MEYLADRVKGNIDHKNLEQFHEFIRGYTDIFTSNIYARKDFTYHNLCGIIQNKNIAVVKGDFNNNFHNDERYKDMQVDSNQPALYYGTAKTHKFETSEDITVANLKFRPTRDQAATFTYSAPKVISDYLRPLCKNEYSINDTQKFPSMLSSIPPLQDVEENV